MGDTEGAFGPTSTKPAASTVTQPAATSTVKPIINPDGTVTVPGTGTFRKLPNGNYEKIT